VKVEAPPTPVLAVIDAPVVVEVAPAVEPEPDPAPSPVSEQTPAPRHDVETISATSVPPPAPVTAGYAKGFFIHSADGKQALALQARVMPRYTSERTLAKDGTFTTTSAFALNDAILQFSGFTFTPAVAYKAEIQFGKGSVALKDFYTDLRIAPATVLRVGQFPRPFSRQQITSGGAQELDDRAITDKAFGAGRDIGVALHDDYTKSPPFEWAIGVFNGTGEAPAFTGTSSPDTNMVTGSFTNVPARFKPVFVGRAGANFGKINGYSEGDLDDSQPCGAVAVSVLTEGDYDKDHKAATRTELDGVFKVHGLALDAAVYGESLKQTGMGPTTYTQKRGVHAQASFTIVQRHMIAARFAIVDVPGDHTYQTETTFGYSMFLRGHDLKWQTDVSMVHDVAHAMGDDLRARTQIQLGF